jgi:hypothetical protein
MNAHKFGGLWTYPSREYPEHDDFMSIDEERCRIIVFTVLFSPPPKYVGMRNWYQPVSDTTIRSRISPKNEWLIHEFLLEENRLSWTYGGAVQILEGVWSGMIVRIGWITASRPRIPEWMTMSDRANPAPPASVHRADCAGEGWQSGPVLRVECQS